MTLKRKDNKGRLLRTGESQRKDGKYEFKYFDLDGQRSSAYSWKLVSTDKIPGGAKEDISLREKEQLIQKELEQGNSIRNSRVTLAESIRIYLEVNKFANSTYENYMYYYNKDIRNSSLGRLKVSDIKKSDIKRFYSQKSKQGYADGTIQILHKIIHPTIQMLVEDEVISKNPAEGCCRDYTSLKSREAMTGEEQSIFFEEVLKYNRNCDRYYLIFTVMTELACRINELIGLTWNDIDMKMRVVTIDHGIVYRRKDGKTQFYATENTIKNAKRKIPMTDEAYQCFCKLKEKRLEYPSKMEVGGYKDFVFVSKSGTPLYPANLNKMLSKMINKYNKETGNKFPDISNHIFRHSGCTNMAESEVDPNALMHIMGHRDLKMIMRVYDSVNFERVRKQMDKMNKKSTGANVG